MAKIYQDHPWERRLYSALFLFSALLHLVFLITFIHAFSWLSIVPWFFGSFSAALILLGILIWRSQAKPEAPHVLRITILCSLLAGAILGPLIAFGASGPNEAALGIALMTFIPLPFNLTFIQAALSSGVSGGIIISLVLHFLAVSGIFLFSFWTTHSLPSIRHRIQYLLYLVFATTACTFISGTIYSLLTGRLTALLFNYGGWTLLFILPCIPLLIYSAVPIAIFIANAASKRRAASAS